MILHDSVYHLHPHLFDFVLDIFWESVDISFCIRFFAQEAIVWRLHRLKLCFASFCASPQPSDKASDFWQHRGDHQGHLPSFGNGIFESDERSSGIGHPWKPRNLRGDHIRTRSKIIKQLALPPSWPDLAPHHERGIRASTRYRWTSPCRHGEASWLQEGHQDSIEPSTSLEAHHFEPASFAGHHSHILADLRKRVVHICARDILLDQFSTINLAFGWSHQEWWHQFLEQTRSWKSSSSHQQLLWLGSGWDWLIKSFHHQGESHPAHLWCIHLASRISLGLSHPIPCIVSGNIREHQVLLCIDQGHSRACWSLHPGRFVIKGIPGLCQCLHPEGHQYAGTSKWHQTEVQRPSGASHLRAEEQSGKHRELCIEEGRPSFSAIIPQWRSGRSDGIRRCETSMWVHHTCRWISFHPHGTHRACRCIEGILKSATGRRTSERVTSLIHRLDSWILIWDTNFLLYSMSSTQHLFE